MTDMTATHTPTVVDGVNVDELITAEVLTEYRERGYWVSPRLFSAEQIAEMREAQERMWAGEHDSEILPQYGAHEVEPGSPDVRQQCNAFWLSDVIRKVTTSPLLGAIGARFMGVDTVRLWHDQAVYKPGIGPDGKDETAGNIGWHQDYNYWGAWEEDSELFTAWVALSDVSPEAGPMNFVAGSHRWGLSTESDFYSQEYASLRETIRSAHGQEWREVPAILPPGSASFHQKLTFHGSGPNLSSQPRRSFAVHMRTENSRPKGDLRQGLTAFIDDPAFCPIVFGDAGALL